MRAEKKEFDISFDIEPAYLGYHRKWWVIYHYHIIMVINCLVISSGIKRPYHLLSVKAIFFVDVIQHDLIHFRRRIAVVGSILHLEFINKGIVIIKQISLFFAFVN